MSLVNIRREYFMKIIDDKGRLFGKINIIDFLIILFLLHSSLAVYSVNKTISKKPVAVVENPVLEEPAVEKPIVEDSELVMELNCKFIKVKPEILKLISVGDKEINKNGISIGEILWVGEVEPHQYKIDIGAGRSQIIEDLVLRDLSARVRIKTEMKGNMLYYKDKQIIINSSFNFKTEKYILSGVIIDIGIE